MINKVVLVGRWTKDLVLRQTQTGVAVATGTLAINRPFANNQGESVADFINIVIWRKQGENAVKYTGKGSLVGVTGTLQSRSYTDGNGTVRYITEVVADSVQFLESKKGNGESKNDNVVAENKTTSQNGAENIKVDTTNQSGINDDPFAQVNQSKTTVTEDDLPF